MWCGSPQRKHHQRAGLSKRLCKLQGRQRTRKVKLITSGQRSNQSCLCSALPQEPKGLGSWSLQTVEHTEAHGRQRTWGRHGNSVSLSPYLGPIHLFIWRSLVSFVILSQEKSYLKGRQAGRQADTHKHTPLLAAGSLPKCQQ